MKQRGLAPPWLMLDRKGGKKMPGTRKAALAPLYAPGGGLLCFVRLGARGGLHGSVDKLLQTGQPGVERLKICDNGLSLCKQSLQLGFVIRRRHRGLLSDQVG